MASGGESPLRLDPERMRELGYRTVDMLVERLTGPSGAVVRSATPHELRERLASDPPEEPTAYEEILDDLGRDVLPCVARISHPGYLAFIPGEGTWPLDERSILYLSDQSHSSLARATRALGFRPDRVRVIPTDRQARMRPDALRSAVDADRAAGLEPLCVIGNAGTTAVGAIDPLAELSGICREHGIWLHVDGAYGAFACLTDRGRAALAGLDLADSS
jgi:hypothetical protein